VGNTRTLALGFAMERFWAAAALLVVISVVGLKLQMIITKCCLPLVSQGQYHIFPGMDDSCLTRWVTR